MTFYRPNKLSYNDNNIEDAFTAKETELVNALVDIVKRNYYSEKDIFIRPLERFYNESLEGLWLTLDDFISWHICFSTLDNYSLLDKIEDYIYKVTNIHVYADLYDNCTLLIYID